MNVATSRQQSDLVSARLNTSRLNSGRGQSSHTTICKICDASYRPAPTRTDLLCASPDALESAFMSICHFCFRCRRAACPACWDEVHRVCAECVQEAQLSFRAEVLPLQGTLFPATPSSIGYVATDAPIAPLLVCVRAGRFQHERALVSCNDTEKETETNAQKQSTVQIPDPDRSSPDEPLYGLIQPIQSAGQTQIEAVGQRMQERKGFEKLSQQPSPTNTIQPSTPTSEVEAENATSYGSGGPGGRHSGILLHGSDKPFVRFKGVLQTTERVLNIVLLFLLLLILALVIVAEISSSANGWLVAMFHVDIRGEMAYILSVIGQLRW